MPQSFQGKRFLIVGLGPTGGILASHLAHAGHVVFGLDVSRSLVRKIGRDGLQVTGLTPDRMTPDALAALEPAPRRRALPEGWDALTGLKSMGKGRPQFHGR